MKVELITMCFMSEIQDALKLEGNTPLKIWADKAQIIIEGVKYHYYYGQFTIFDRFSLDDGTPICESQFGIKKCKINESEKGSFLIEMESGKRFVIG